jgi:hypothetical protein
LRLFVYNKNIINNNKCIFIYKYLNGILAIVSISLNQEILSEIDKLSGRNSKSVSRRKRKTEFNRSDSCFIIGNP